MNHKTRIYTQYDTDYPSPGIFCDPTIPGVAMCQQHMAPECDINNIMKRYIDDGIDIERVQKIAQYADVSDIPSLQKCHEIIIDARSNWDAVPAYIRRRFGDDPLEMMTWLQDPKNNEESISLGLRDPKPAPSEPQTVKIDPETIEKIGESVAKKQQKRSLRETDQVQS